MNSPGNGNYFQFNQSNYPELSAGTGMDVDSSGDIINRTGSNGRRFVGEERSYGQDSVDIVFPPRPSNSNPSTTTSNSQDRQSTGTDNESDSRNIFSLIRKATRSGSEPTIPVVPCAEDEVLYTMNHPNRGKCVIFNHTIFDKIQQLPDRTGSNNDVEKIRSTFSMLGFTVVECKDYTFDRIVHRLKSISLEDHSQNDCLAVFVLSHGEANELYAYDMTYKPSVLWDDFTANKCATLAGKPKMFFIQACRGANYDDGTEVKYSRTEVDGPGDQTYKIPNQADFLTVFSTYDASIDIDNVAFLKRTMQYLSLGYYSWRNSKSGSCFIQALCTVFCQRFHYKDVLSMLTLVNREVAIKYESRSKDQHQNRKKQIPHVCHTLMRDIYLHPKHRSTLV